MKYVKGMGVVSSDGRVLMGTGPEPTAAGIVSLQKENADLRNLVLTVGRVGSQVSREAALLAIMEYEMLYGSLDRSGVRPTGVINAFKENK